MRQTVRLVAVDDQIFFTVGSGMNGLPRHLHTAETHADELLDEFVMVAADVNHLGLLATFAENFLDEHVVVVAPEPTKLQLPAVNEIADDIEILAIHHAQEFQQLRHAGMAGAEMDVRDPNRAANDRLVQIQIQMGLVNVHNL